MIHWEHKWKIQLSGQWLNWNKEEQINKLIKKKPERVIIILRRITRDYNQEPAVIPPLFCPLVYKELHVDMGYLGVDRIWQKCCKRLIFWINIVEDIKYFAINVCTFYKQKKNTYPRQHLWDQYIQQHPFPLLPIIFQGLLINHFCAVSNDFEQVHTIPMKMVNVNAWMDQTLDNKPSSNNQLLVKKYKSST